MKSSTKAILVVVTLLLIFGAFALLNGWFSGSKSAHPPCDQLPSLERVTKELANHQDLAEKIKALGDDITVEVGQPCSDDQDRGLIMISYGSKSERNAIDNLLSRSEGFGAPAYLVKR